MDTEEIGRRIKRARDRAGLTQEDLGRKIGYEQGTISAYERGKVNGITLDVLSRLARATKASMSELLGGEPSQGPTIEAALYALYPDIGAETVEQIVKTADAFVYLESIRRSHTAQKESSAGNGNDHTGTG